MKYCTKCGTQCADSANFCTACGAPMASVQEPVVQPVVEEKPVVQPTPNYNYSYNTESGNSFNSTHNSRPNYSAPTPGIVPRNIVVAIVLSIVTCGIYGIYWMIKLNDETNALAGEVGATSGGMVFLFTLISCGIYSLFWSYKMGERMDKIKGQAGNSHILFLVLAIFGFGIINYCLLQDTINKTVS